MLFIVMPYIPLLALLMFLLSSASSAAEDPGEADQLVMIQVLTRHGDRAAQADPFITPQAPYVFFRGPGELSDAGIAHAEETGRAYRLRYNLTGFPGNKGFIDSKFLPSEASYAILFYDIFLQLALSLIVTNIEVTLQATFQSSAVDRVLMSAGSFSSGLFRSIIQAVHAPVYTVPYADDSDQILAAMRSSEWECKSPPGTQSDTLLAEAANPLTRIGLSPDQKECADGSALHFMFKYLENLGGSGASYSRARLQRTVGNLANTIVDTFKFKYGCFNGDIVNDTCAHTPKAQFRFAHDVNLLALMNTFSNQAGASSFFAGKTPAYAASLSIELWNRAGQPIVKMYLKNGVDAEFEEFRWCEHLPAEWPRHEDCSLDILERAKNLFIGREQAQCTLKKPCCTPLGTWSEWSTTGNCATTCGSCSTAKRTRTCLSLADGCPCRGEESDSGPCGITLCPFPATYACCSPNTKFFNKKTKQFFCGTEEAPTDPTDCPTCCPPNGGTWSEWSTTGNCATTCGSCSTATRTRTCLTLADGCPCRGEESDSGPCGISLCPFPSKPCCSYYIKSLNEKSMQFFCGTEDVPKNPTDCATERHGRQDSETAGARSERAVGEEKEE